MNKIISKFVKRPVDSVIAQQGIQQSKSKTPSACGTSWNYQRVSTPINGETELRDRGLSHNQMAINALAWLHTVAPAIPVSGNKVKILHEPSEFYHAIIENCKTAKHRITLASLYLGTGELEQNLVQTIQQRMRDLQGQINVTLLFDHSRGSRGTVNSCTMVTPLLKEHPKTCQVSLYHTVALRGLLKKLVPQRYNELVGLQHMKLYLFDDTLIISGANLSNDYFTNRQDRYVVVKDCKELADFYANLVSRVCEFSLQLQPDGVTSLHPSWPAQCHPYKGSKTQFVEEARSRIWETFTAKMSRAQRTLGFGEDTWIFPLIQMGQLGVRHDSEVTLRILESAPRGSHIHLTTGYFNLTEQLISSLLERSSSNISILSAHPSANGFLNAKGPAGGIPAAYTQLANVFFSKMCELGVQNRIDMCEYVRPGWTYHGKGLWLTLPGQVLPSLTLIGSPNFGARSVERDLESQIAIVTTNSDLQRRLAEERDRLYKSGVLVTRETFSLPERKVPTWVYYASSLFKNFF